MPVLDDRPVDAIVGGPIVVAPLPAEIAALAALMVTHRIHGVLVTHADGEEWASDLEVLRAAVAGDRRWRPGHRRRAPVVQPRASLRATARALVAADASHCLVVDGDAVTGVVSALDLCGAAAGVAVRSEAPPVSTTLSFDERRLERVEARRAMHHGVVTADPATPLVDVARTMAQTPVHCVVVEGVRRDGGGEHLVWGVVSDLDVVRALAGGLDDAVAADVAATEPVCVDATDPLDEVARRLCEHDVAHVIVTDPAGRPCGVVSTLDVLRVVACDSGI